MRIDKLNMLVTLHLLTLAVLVDSKCSVREPPGVTSPPQRGDAGFQLSINEQPEFYEERNLYTITLKVNVYQFNDSILNMPFVMSY